MTTATASIGVDLGGTTYSVGWLDPAGALHDRAELETRSYRPPAEVVADLARAIEAAARQARSAAHAVAGVGVGVPAVIDPWAGKVLLPPNFAAGWAGYPLAAELAARTGLPVWLINDARAFTFAESRLGAGRGVGNLLGVTLGTGVGGGTVLNGQLYLGAYGTAGEFGHQVYDPHGPSCGCGGAGCVEVYASGPAVVAAAARPLRGGRAPILREIVGNSLERLTPKAVAEAAGRGEEECVEIWARAGEVLGVGISNVLGVLGLERVVVGGGLAKAGEVLFGPMRRAVARHARTLGGRTVEVVPAALEEPGLTGAAVWALEQAGRPGAAAGGR